MRLFCSILISLTSILISCNQPDNKEAGENMTNGLPPEERAEKNLQEEVIAVHDEVMPKMDDLMRLKDQLLVKMDSLQVLENNEEKVKELRTHIDQLRKADSAMMSWMRQFKPVRDTINHEERMDYLQKEKARIEKVREMMNTAIENARKKVN